MLEKNFDFKNAEKKIYDFWLENNFFEAKVNNKKKSFCIMMPPPNITGALHMGHALDCTLQDIIIRFKRMQGFEVLWLPGTDHASISTELKIIEQLKLENLDKKNIGREKFLEYAHAWKDKYGNKIIEQIKCMGCSCDWSRIRFTLDENFSRTVNYVFKKLYEKDLIYKGEKIINFCTQCKTVISDAEVKHEERENFLYFIKYKLKDSQEFIEFATTRPETLLGDTAIAVNPDDARYKNFIGKYVTVPFVNREIKIIADSYVDMNFGTGVVKITPGHDINDFEMAKRHDLEIINILDDNGILNQNAKKYAGLNLDQARQKILCDLKEINLFVRKELINNSIGVHDRCNNIIEPLVKPQWFVRIKKLVAPGIKAYKSGEIKFFPKRFGKIYLNWLENLNDWCISRQLWWGHRIPVYYCKDCGFINITCEKKLNACNKCKSQNIFQDEDVLDTWFSSALWPAGTLGWPEENLDYKYFYPTDVLVTGYDIILFWVIRMVLMGFENTKRVAFKHVLIHGLVRDEHGRKMSKSLNNGIDPVDIIKKFGVDCLRLSLIINNSLGNDLKFSLNKLESNKLFLNKIWNAGKFVIANLELEINLEKNNLDLLKLDLADKWILIKLNNLVHEVNLNLENYEHGVALAKIYDFIWNEFCDWYIEIIKIRLYCEQEDLNKKLEITKCLKHVFETCLKLLHIYAPFITERLFLELNNKKSSIMIASWPVYDKDLNKFSSCEKDFEFLKEIIRAIRNLRAEMNIHPAKKSHVCIKTSKLDLKNIIIKNKKIFLLAGIDKIKFTDVQDAKKNLEIVLNDLVIYLPVANLLDIKQELERLTKEKEKTQKEISRAQNKLQDKNFVSRAPKELVERERDKLKNYDLILKKILERIKVMSEFE